MSSDKQSGRAVIVVQDGLGDRPVPSLGGLTPLEAAATPHMDELAASGICGIVDILAPGIKVGTDVGHLVLFGQDPQDGNYGRGPMEAAGLGVTLQPGDVAVRFNFATVDEDGQLQDRRAGRIRTGTESLAAALEDACRGAFDEVEVIIRAATEHRGAIVLRGPGLSPRVSDSDPGSAAFGIQQIEALEASREAERTAEILNDLTRKALQCLAGHPVNRQRRAAGEKAANAILVRGAGAYRAYRNPGAERDLRVACISGECTVLGMARLSGVTTIHEPWMTANFDTDLAGKAKCAVTALEDFDVVYLHVKGADIAGHDGLPEAKRDFIEKTDDMLGLLLEDLNPCWRCYVALLADHSTPCELGEHSGDPIPVCLAGPDVRTDSVVCYGERSCAQGGLSRLTCRDFLNVLFDYL